MRCIPVLLVALPLLVSCNKGTTTSTQFAEDALDTRPEGRGDAIPAVDLVPSREDLFTGPGEDLAADVGEAPVGTPCSDSKDCPGGYCIEGPDGSVCTLSCVTECPEGYSCKGVDLYGGDLVWLCIPDWWDLCTPCVRDTDCAGEGNLCVQVPGEGLFCGLACGETGTCPVSYACTQAERAEDAGFAWQCLPDGGASCLCQEENTGETKACEITNQFGTCAGVVTCQGGAGWGPCNAATPREEICNGGDDDCDGEADEGFADSDTDGEADCVDKDDDGDGVPDGLDNCPLTPNAGQSDFDDDALGDACDDDDDDDNYADPADCNPFNATVHPGAPEICDGKDNNCNGQVDEGYADPDVDGLASCVDPDDDNDGVLDDEDCNPSNFNIYPGSVEACDSIDNDCDGKVDEGFPDLDEDGIADCTDIDTDGDGDPDLTDCQPTNGAVYEGAAELCDGLDNNCNGQVDEGFPDI
ncbi:MAG: putative metal-binding motif-containing protein, partial [Deltaproteobacteria bacterium]|nr:putative metal-binding motif-containing protein [Deltaproteobacteria bacterium]